MLILGNPPFNKGGEIWDVCRKFTSNIVWIMPINQYKFNNRYQYIDKKIQINPKSFDHTMIPNNLCITTCTSTPNTKKTFTDVLVEFFNSNYSLYYSWNKQHYRGLYLARKDGKQADDLNIDVDFIESGRCPSYKSGAGFGYNGCGYKFNVLKSGYDKQLLSHLALLHLPTVKSKDNFCKWWYYDTKGKSLSSKSLVGLNISEVGFITLYSTPQIDWETISDHPLWKEGNYDEAVLDVMGLRWNEDKSGVVKRV